MFLCELQPSTSYYSNTCHILCQSCVYSPLQDIPHRERKCNQCQPSSLVLWSLPQDVFLTLITKWMQRRETLPSKDDLKAALKIAPIPSSARLSCPLSLIQPLKPKGAATRNAPQRPV